MAFSDRRIAALKRAVIRRRRLEEALRAELKQQRNELSTLCARFEEGRSFIQASEASKKCCCEQATRFGGEAPAIV